MIGFRGAALGALAALCVGLTVEGCRAALDPEEYPRYDYERAVWFEEWGGWLVPVETSDGVEDLALLYVLPADPQAIKLIDKGQTAEPAWPEY